jgi:hypothetical protein
MSVRYFMWRQHGAEQGHLGDARENDPVQGLPTVDPCPHESRPTIATTVRCSSRIHRQVISGPAHVDGVEIGPVPYDGPRPLRRAHSLGSGALGRLWWCEKPA